MSLVEFHVAGVVFEVELKHEDGSKNAERHQSYGEDDEVPPGICFRYCGGCEKLFTRS